MYYGNIDVAMLKSLIQIICYAVAAKSCFVFLFFSWGKELIKSDQELPKMK